MTDLRKLDGTLFPSRHQQKQEQREIDPHNKSKNCRIIGLPLIEAIDYFRQADYTKEEAETIVKEITKIEIDQRSLMSIRYRSEKHCSGRTCKETSCKLAVKLHARVAQNEYFGSVYTVAQNWNKLRRSI